MSLSFDERMDTLESLAVKISNNINKLATFDEVNAVREQLFNQIWSNRNRVIALENSLKAIEKTVSTANG